MREMPTGSNRRGRSLRTDEAQPVTFVELFFDLVFVFAVTQLTALTAHDLTPGGILRAVLLGWLIWWAWTQFTWTLNPADTTHPTVRVITLAAAGVTLVMAASVPRAFAEDALWFAVPYVVVRLLGLGIQLQVERDRPDSSLRGVGLWASFSMIGLALVIVGAVVEPGPRQLVWFATIVADLVAAAMAGTQATWALNTAHFAERHALFVIIALGESIVLAGTAVAADERSAALAGVAAAAIVVVCLLWWTYFGWLKEALEHRFGAAPEARLGPLARDAFSIAHFPLIGGIVGFAVAVEEILAHPADPVPTAVVAALGVGIALFVLCSALSLRILGGPLLRFRVVAVAAMAVGLVAVVPLVPVSPLGVAALALAAIALTERGQPTTTAESSGASSPRRTAPGSAS